MPLVPNLFHACVASTDYVDPSMKLFSICLWCCNQWVSRLTVSTVLGASATSTSMQGIHQRTMLIGSSRVARCRPCLLAAFRPASPPSTPSRIPRPPPPPKPRASPPRLTRRRPQPNATADRRSGSSRPRTAAAPHGPSSPIARRRRPGPAPRTGTTAVAGARQAWRRAREPPPPGAAGRLRFGRRQVETPITAAPAGAPGPAGPGRMSAESDSDAVRRGRPAARRCIPGTMQCCCFQARALKLAACKFQGMKPGVRE